MAMFNFGDLYRSRKNIQNVSYERPIAKFRLSVDRRKSNGIRKSCSKKLSLVISCANDLTHLLTITAIACHFSFPNICKKMFNTKSQIK